MAKHQCPNCGGFKTYCWKWKWFLGGMDKAFVAVVVSGILLLLSSELAIAVLVLMIAGISLVKLVQRATRPAGSHVCEICEFSFDPSARQPIQVRPDLIEKGNALLERQRAAAAAAAEEERYQEEQRRWYAGT